MICTECGHAVDDHALKGAKAEDGCIKLVPATAPVNERACGCKLRTDNQEQLGPSPYAVEAVDYGLADGTWIDFKELTLRKLGFIIYQVDKGDLHEWPRGPKWDEYWIKDEGVL